MSDSTVSVSMAHALAASRRFLVAEDVDLIAAAVAELPVDRIVQVLDLGAGSGTTALSVFCARAENIHVLTVDHDPVALASTRECMTNAGFVQHWQGILAKSNGLATVLPYVAGLIDLLLVDADHTYEGVRSDLEAWLPLVRPGAPVWMHDYTAEYPGCMQAIDEAVAAGRLVPDRMAGWGWLGHKPVIVAEVTG